MSEIRERKETGRIEAFSDGVFAIAITLLVLGINVPKASSRPGDSGAEEENVRRIKYPDEEYRKDLQRPVELSAKGLRRCRSLFFFGPR